MKQLKVKKVYTKDIEYEKFGKKQTFKKYAVLSDDTWYTLQGKGKENVKEGDTIMGEYSFREWESNGKSGTEHTLTLVEPLIADILGRLDKLELEVFSGKPKKEFTPPDDNSDLPF